MPAWRVTAVLTDARAMLSPPLAAAALAFALAAMLPRAVAAMAALLLVKAFPAMAWAIQYGGALPPLDLYSVPILAPRCVYPLLGVAALALLWRGRLVSPACWSCSRPASSGSTMASWPC
jgi:hypothetical protein